MKPSNRNSWVHKNLLLTLLGVVLLFGTAASNELSAGSRASGLEVHTPEETLRDHTTRDRDGQLFLVLPSGARFELITSIDDPAILNRGDGAFHPFDEHEVRAALAEVSFPLEGINADVFILPYPRRGGLESAAGNELILLAPGVRPISPQKQHAELVHELGHVVQRALLPDSDVDGWNEFRQMRGIQDRAVYTHQAVHANRPHEIFAEDFRFLFGGSTARYSGTIENHVLELPTQIAGLGSFMLDLGGVAAKLQFTAYPNPTPNGLRFALAGAKPVALDLYDVSGRRIATLAPSVNGNSVQWRWNRQDASGRRVGAGVVFAKLRDGRGTTARVTLLP